MTAGPADPPHLPLGEKVLPLGERVAAVADWLIDQGLGDPDLAATFAACCERLCAAGLPLWRVHISFRTLHPLFEAVALTWTHGTGLEDRHLPHDAGVPRDAWRRSPLYHVIEQRLPGLRRRLTGAGARLDFPILEELREQGASDYVAFLVPFDPSYQNGVIGSWTTRRPQGFTEDDLRALDRIQKHLALACKVKIQNQISRNVVTTYLGPETGAQVLGGTIKRGDGEAIEAVVWYSDLRRSTELIQELSVERFLSLLNRYFDCTAGAVRAQGGEVVTLVGDAVLAVFRADQGSSFAGAGRRALNAALDARSRLAAVNRELGQTGTAVLRFGVALHLGSVIYGNIGIPDRLEFTIVGPAVNEAVRIEALTKALGRTILASEEFVYAVPGAWQSLGHHALRGVPGEYEIFAPGGDQPVPRRGEL